MELQGKKILLGISGSIAAYKSAFLARLLIKAGVEVQVLMTPSACDFISPLTLSTLSKNTVFTDVSSADAWNNHVELGLWADALLVAPATANTIAKLANGLADSMIAAAYLSARCPVFIAPAMDLDMWKHSATRRNVEALVNAGDHIIPVGHGELASGLVGDGRMAEPEAILQHLRNFFHQQLLLQGKTVLVTAGPTYEPIDPVRFIGNRSSGRMGIALAEEAARRGAKVHLILGPTHLAASHSAINTIRVQTAQEMYEATKTYFPNSDILILAAAVADYRPTHMADEKIKKSDANMQVELEKTIDIAATLGKQKSNDQIIVGFALETTNELANAQSKLKRKNFDFIVLNSLKEEGAGFNHTTNKITIVHKDNKPQEFELKSKTAVAVDIFDVISQLQKPVNS